MKITYMPSKVHPSVNNAILDYDEITPKNKTTLHIFHSNQDDGYYSYGFEVTGTKKELEVIKEFCEKIMEAK